MMGVEPTNLTRADFLLALHEGCEGLAELRALPSKTTRFYAAGEEHVVAQFALAREAENIFIGVATRKDRTSGDLQNCHHLAALFVDLDFKKLPEVGARAALARFPLAPSMVIHSGGGLHAYWNLREPMALPEEAPGARDLLRRLAHALGGDLSSAEPARVLRVPGTRNHKYTPPRDVVLESLDFDRRYNPSDFDEILPVEPVHEGRSAPFTMPDEPLAEGEGRNNALYRVVRSMRFKNMSAKAIVAAAEAENALFKPPLPADELQALIKHALTQPDRPDFATRRSGVDQPATEETIAPPSAPVERPVIDTSNLGLDEMAKAAWEAIVAANKPPRIYLYAGALSWLASDPEGRPHVEVMSLDHVRHHLADVATFVRPTGGSRGRPADKRPRSRRCRWPLTCSPFLTGDCLSCAGWFGCQSSPPAGS